MTSPEETSKNDSLGILFPQLFNPLKYAKVLIQLGYEPMPPFIGHNLLSIFNITNKTLRYPWIGRYVYFMYEKRGLVHLLTTGFFARLSLDTLNNVSQKLISQRVCEYMGDEDVEDVIETSSWKDFAVILLEISVFKLYEVFITHPFKVIMTRQMADFIVNDDKNAWFYQAVACIYRENRFQGFYKGLFPSIIAELCKCSIYYLSCRIVHKMLKNPQHTQLTALQVEATSKRNQTLKLLSRSVLKYAFSNVFYPFEVVSTVMMIDGVYLGKYYQLSDFNSWRKCWRTLKMGNQLTRGYSFVFRNHVKPS